MAGYALWVQKKNCNVYVLFASGNLAAATDLKTLKDKNIRKILTIDSCPLPDLFRSEIDGHIQNKYVEGKYNYYNKNLILFLYLPVSDLAADDLLSQIDDCIAFIESSLPEPIMVHW